VESVPTAPPVTPVAVAPTVRPLPSVLAVLGAMTVMTVILGHAHSAGLERSPRMGPPPARRAPLVHSPARQALRRAIRARLASPPMPDPAPARGSRQGRRRDTRRRPGSRTGRASGQTCGGRALRGGRLPPGRAGWAGSRRRTRRCGYACPTSAPSARETGHGPAGAGPGRPPLATSSWSRQGALPTGAPTPPCACSPTPTPISTTS
jgi:hypothetical protein